MGWLRWVGSFKSKVSFAEYPLFHRALLQKRLMILRSLLIAATPFSYVVPTIVSSTHLPTVYILITHSYMSLTHSDALCINIVVSFLFMSHTCLTPHNGAYTHNSFTYTHDSFWCTCIYSIVSLLQGASHKWITNVHHITQINHKRASHHIYESQTCITW